MAGIDRGATKLKIEKPRRDGVCAFVGTNPNIQLQRASVGRLTTDARRFRRSKLKNRRRNYHLKIPRRATAP